jgi:predicted alpha/beta-fold hydrolase
VAAPVVLLHGWEGSAEALYVLSLARQLFEQRFEVVRLNLRDHGDTHHLNRELFHSCRLPEVVGAVAALQRLFGGRALQLIGFSLGGNFMLRVAAQASAAGLNLTRVIAVSPVLEPVATLAALQRGMPGYEAYFVRKWLRSLRKKQAAWPDIYDFAQLARLRDLKLMTAELVRSYTDFPTLDHYLNGYAITGERLARLEVPSTILTSLDDPIIPAGGLAQLARPAALSLTVTRYGGHCGFFDQLRGPTWLERRIVGLLGGGAGGLLAGGQEVATELRETS